jgi:hypothetical protein
MTFSFPQELALEVSAELYLTGLYQIETICQ